MEASTIDAVFDFVINIAKGRPRLIAGLIMLLILRGVASAIVKAYVSRKEAAKEPVKAWVYTAKDVLSFDVPPGKWGLLFGLWQVPGLPSFGKGKPAMPPADGGAA